MWRPELHPLPCRQNVAHTTGADGQHSFAVREAVPSGTVLEISLCVEVSVIAVDQFPFLRDFVLTGEMENGFADQGETNIEELDKQVLYFIPPLTLFQCPNQQ